MEVSFELIEQMLDRDNNPIFRTEVRIEGLPAGSGTGYSKKESQQNASRIALKKIKNGEAFLLEILQAKERNHTYDIPELPVIVQEESTDEMTNISGKESVPMPEAATSVE